ncbi:ABC transporter ATP-binding protein [Corallincola luteus]|uniref:ABC transporter ATP-binding protein n=3 Tax=Corallincola TaxID=1775176 RepID=A0A368NSQ2_9GAMM|nr:ABC transporter ATP-binding protein [Corallincola luteus]RCU52855.1 ABC transporter ATP-binding protein [Corallincola holothuriorum]TCI03353.1 ABC transporter ATP-binding protein [Corallincola luteus]
MRDETALNMIEFQQVSYTVDGPEGSLSILDGVSLQVKQGETVAIIGPSGAGKSSLLSLAAGLERVSAGGVSVAGQSITNISESALAAMRAEHIGFVFQSFLLIPELTAVENLTVPSQLCGKILAKGQAEGMLEKVGLAQRARHYPQQMSGGEQQRLAIARAFVHQPNILLADEPTGNLDRANGEHISELLFELNEAQGTTLLLVTHDEALAAKCQRVLRLTNGQLEVVKQ